MKRILFMHVPRTGGTAVRQYLRQDLKGQVHLMVTHHAREKCRWDKPTPLLADCKRFPKAFVVACVRNPWSRVLSAWRAMPQSKGPMLRRLARQYSGKPFSVFVQEQITAEGALRDVWFRPQAWFLYNGETSLVNGLCKYESLSADLQVVLHGLGVEVEVSLPRAGIITESSSYAEAYDDQTREIVATAYTDDIAKFGYTFGG